MCKKLVFANSSVAMQSTGGKSTSFAAGSALLGSCQIALLSVSLKCPALCADSSAVVKISRGHRGCENMGSSGSQPVRDPEQKPRTEKREAIPLPYPIPYVASIPGGLQPSRVITVSGTVLPNAKRFHISLHAGTDIAFHLNPRFSENTVIRNSRINGSWGPEEKSWPVNMPFIPEHSFKVEIICKTDRYKVTVDGHHLLEYTHRLKDLPAINALEVAGDIKLTGVQV
ncbi:PREDICTED: galectin-5-like [Chinchilla lanigera]|uniref:galectin-5-like n=1 Tax=Chinchilla lanigera TaxID=34839 RepID=UPI0006968A0B|nr:PREDICTED: galectin-5-like [Chinchilla lanigera]